MSGRKPLLKRVLLIVIVLALSSCRAPTPTPEPTPLAKTGDEVVITFQLEGGIAGLCYELAIQRDGDYHLSSCKHPDSYGVIGGHFLAQLLEWDGVYAPFEIRDEDAPGSPDALVRRLIWRGAGREPSGEETRQEILRWMSELPVEELRTAYAEEGVLQSARAYLAEILELEAEDVSLVAYEAASWPDTALGCPREGQSYAQVVTAGYKISFTVDEKEYYVHTNADGSSVVLCPKAAPEGSFAVYASPELLFSIAYPREWSPTLSDADSQVVIAPEGDDASIGMSVSLLGGGYSAADAEDLLVGDYWDSVTSQDASAVEVDEPEAVETTGASGQRMSYYVSLANQKFRHYTATVLIDERGNAFRIVQWTPREAYWDHVGDFSKVLHSFEPLSGTEVPPQPTGEPGPTGAPTATKPQTTPAPTGMFVGTFEGYAEAANIPDRKASVRGRVLDSNGNPMVGHALRLSAFDWHIDHTTGGDGSYAFDWLDQELTFTVTPLSFSGNPVEVLTEFGKAGIVNYQQP